MRIGIVGHESAKFTPVGEALAMQKIKCVLQSYPDPVLVSGRCPIAECENCRKLKVIPATINPTVVLNGYFECPLCHEIKARRKGGVDIYSELVADLLNIPKEIKIPKQNWWDGPYGFKARNIDIATVSEVMYVIVVNCYALDYVKKEYDSDEYCFHCHKSINDEGGHIKSGGCWTGKYFQSVHGTKANWIIIDQKDYIHAVQ
jgi:hypothetical protein